MKPVTILITQLFKAEIVFVLLLFINDAEELLKECRRLVNKYLIKQRNEYHHKQNWNKNEKTNPNFRMAEYTN
jgi:hypothetical protein